MEQGYWQIAGQEYQDAVEFYQGAKFKALVVIPKITATLSIAGSSLIIRDVFQKENRRKKLKATTNRIVSLMSVCDAIYTFVMHFLGTWLVPELPWLWSAAGNEATCTFQGFVGRLFAELSTALNATLAVTYILIVRYSWKEERLQTYFMSFMLLGVPALASIGILIWPLINHAFNWIGTWTCTIGPYPVYCEFDEDLCISDNQAQHIDLSYMVWLLVCFTLIFISTVTLYWTVLGKERAMDRYDVGANHPNHKQSKRVAMQGMWYAGSFFVTWIFYWVSIILDYGKTPVPYWLTMCVAILTPLQGLFNAIVFFRPRFVGKKNRNGQNSGCSTGRSSLSCCTCGIFGSCKFAKASDTEVSATAAASRRSGDDPPSANAADNQMGQFKEEEKREEEAPVTNGEP